MSQTRLTIAVTLAVGLGGGCAGGRPPGTASDATPGMSEACAAFRHHPVALWTDAEVVRQGATLPLLAGSTLARASGSPMPQPIPIGCLSDWRITPEGAATISPDGTSFTVADDAPAGEYLLIEARTPGELARYRTRIVGRDERVLTGRWSQAEVDCGEWRAPSEPVRELEFSDGGRFSVTFTPFERFRDYWGTANGNPDDDRLSLTVEGGNNRPDGLILSGWARLETDRRLVLDGFNLGNGNQWNFGAPCRYVFTR